MPCILVRSALALALLAGLAAAAHTCYAGDPSCADCAAGVPGGRPRPAPAPALTPRDVERQRNTAAQAARRAAMTPEQHDSQRAAHAAAEAARRAAAPAEERDSQRAADAAAHAARRAAEAPAQRAARRAGDAAAHHDARHGQGPYTLAAPADMPTDEYHDTFERNAIANEANFWARSGLWRFEAFRDWDYSAVARGSVGCTTSKRSVARARGCQEGAKR